MVRVAIGYKVSPLNPIFQQTRNGLKITLRPRKPSELQNLQCETRIN